ncbi:hypothetical protein FDK38_005212 [Candidozyma auris]|nr:hypothetical protein FDK38_005212 [[Candida] auris]
MKFSKAFVSGLVATTAVSASPIDSTELAKRENVDVLLGRVETLLATVVQDVSTILSHAGINQTAVFEPIFSSLNLEKREENVARFNPGEIPTVLGDIAQLVTDILKDVGSITADGLKVFTT